ncbi:septum site-determining protein MinC [Marinomonas transparens]|uniref:Probable septum site-determining protein MinC n=1 Tax=Marinomonas transparens TaxID=2795388 RepID=A0A934MZP8_9GAMM|nr:septum site-determining protein MinC [Marinomonas transparens]MBJ7537775.1 septum site-determining protein MinC [Marinomonas transparens]
MLDSGFRLKGSVVTTFLLEIQTFSFEEIVSQLQEKIAQVPQFFSQAPIIIDVSKMESLLSLKELEALVLSVNRLGLSVIGWRCHAEKIPEWHADVMVPLLPASKTRQIAISEAAALESRVAKADPDVVIKTVVEERLVSPQTKVITKPIRSGQQVYAEGDLVVLTQVSAGAEVLADGNIHVYGALRGRALAGVKGDINARIFCQSMEAELVSIAGNFMLSDALQDIVWKEGAQVLLVDDNLTVEPL